MIKFIQRVLIVLFVISVLLFGVSAWKNASLIDTNGPEITMDADSVTVSVDSSDEEILAGVRATDSKDGDVSDSLVVEGLSNFIETGRREATIAAFDSDNNVTKITREVVYSDYVSPHFALKSPLRFDSSVYGGYADGFTVTDCLDGDLSSAITITLQESVPESVTEKYIYNFKVTNSAGDVAELPLTVEFYDASEDNRYPKAVLSDYLIYVPVGTNVRPMDYVEGIEGGGVSLDMDELEEMEDLEDPAYTRSNIQVVNPVDSNTPGVYEIVYSVKNEDDYQAEVRLIVIVEE